MQSTISRRAFVTGLGMLSVPLIALAQDRGKGNDKSREEQKKEAENKANEKRDEVTAKDKEDIRYAAGAGIERRGPPEPT